MQFLTLRERDVAAARAWQFCGMFLLFPYNKFYLIILPVFVSPIFFLCVLLLLLLLCVAFINFALTAHVFTARCINYKPPHCILWCCTGNVFILCVHCEWRVREKENCEQLNNNFINFTSKHMIEFDGSLFSAIIFIFLQYAKGSGFSNANDYCSWHPHTLTEILAFALYDSRFVHLMWAQRN